MALSSQDLLELRISYFIEKSPIRDVELQDLLCLIDSPKFLALINEYRSEHKIISPILTKNEIAKVSDVFKFAKNPFELTDKQLGQLFSASESWQLIEKEALGKISLNLKSFEQDLQMVLGELQAMYQYRNVIAQSILFGFVGYKHSLNQIIKKDSELNESMYVIVPTERTTYAEIKQALRDSDEYFKQLRKLNQSNKPSPIQQNISAYHQWYWKRVEGLKYREIANWWNDVQGKQDQAKDDNDILKGVKRYKQLLKH